MLIRALLVLLLVLNAGVAAWWIWHTPAAPAQEPEIGSGPRLEMVEATHATAAPAPRPGRCYRYGPFSDPRAFEAARAAIASSVLWTATAEQALSPPRAWRVVLPQPDRATAQAAAARIGAAGFSDLFVLPETGEDANTIALGRYRSEPAAQERAAALAAAGFPAVAQPVGARMSLWLDVAADAAQPAASPALGLTGAAIDCSGVTRGARYTIPAPA